MAAVVTGKGFIETAKLLTGVGSPVAFSYLALGTGSQTEDTTVTALATEITEASGLSRVSAATVTTASSATAGDTAKFSHTWTSTKGSTVSVKECGVFNSSTSGVCLAYATFATAIPMESADTLSVTWSVQCKAG